MIKSLDLADLEQSVSDFECNDTEDALMDFPDTINQSFKIERQWR